jgi:predicted ATP-dependent endonuclease of OLD family
MKIKSIKISNVLSFAYKENFDSESADIEFGNDLNIIVGPNGSGKSNFVEILFNLFQDYFNEVYEYNYGFDNEAESTRSFFKRSDNQGQNLRLEKHNDYLDKPSNVELIFDLNESDKNNLEFIKNNSAELSILSKKYYRNRLDFNTPPFSDVNIKHLSEIKIKFNITIPVNHEKYTISPEFSDDKKDISIVHFYLKNLNIINKLINTGVERESKNWYPLNYSFEFLGSQRSFSSFPISISFTSGLENNATSIIVQKKNQSIKDQSDVHQVLSLAISKVGRQIRKDMRSTSTIKQAVDKQFTNPHALYFQVNNSLKEYLNLSIRYKGLPSVDSDTFYIELFDTDTKKTVQFQQLSSGQRSIVNLIFISVIMELENGLLIIDEPELHLHPSLQRKYFDLLKKFSKEANLQSIIITHSPVFIDEKTIKNTYRFYIEDRKTKIIKGDSVTTPEEELIKFLSYTNSAKIFFTNKVILVEGESDNYFYTYLINNHISFKGEVEFLTIDGKNEYKKWFDFLNKFKIKYCLITDFDFLMESKRLKIKEAQNLIMSKKFGEELQERMAKVLGHKKSILVKNLIDAMNDIKDKNHNEITEENFGNIKNGWIELIRNRISFSEIAAEIRNDPDQSAVLDEIITDYKKRNILILKWGNLEDYLKINKGLKYVVEYCNDKKYKSMEEQCQKDLQEIFLKIDEG